MPELEDYVMPESYGATIGKCLTFDEIQAPLAAERERCAKVCDRFAAAASREANTTEKQQIREAFKSQSSAARAAADLIRSLTPQAEGGQT